MKQGLDLNRVASTRETAMWVLFLILVTLLGFQQWYQPITDELKPLKAKLEAKKKELASFQKMALDAEIENKKKQALPDFNSQLVAKKVKEAFEKSNLTPDVALTELTADLNQPAFTSAAILEKINMTSKNKQVGFTEMKLDLKIIGSYDGIAKFLIQMAKLPYLMKIEAIQVKPADLGTPGVVELAGKGALYVGDGLRLNTASSAGAARSDRGTDLLMELNANKNPSSTTPFAEKPKDAGSWSIQEMKLTGILAGSNRPMAIINGQLFDLGDEIGDFRLVEVNSRDVVLQKGEIRRSLKISEEGWSSKEEIGPSSSRANSLGPFKYKEEPPPKTPLPKSSTLEEKIKKEEGSKKQGREPLPEEPFSDKTEAPASPPEAAGEGE